jgi:hypothetical protein
MYLGGSLAPSIQIVGSLLIPPGWQRWPIKWSEHNSNGFDRLENLAFWTLSILGIDHYCCMSLENESFQVLKKKSNVVKMSKIDICLRASCAKLVFFIYKKCFSFVSKLTSLCIKVFGIINKERHKCEIWKFDIQLALHHTTHTQLFQV